MRQYRESLIWTTRYQGRKLKREMLVESLRLGRRYMVRNQTPLGNFNYQYDFVKKELDPGDSQVRQAGAIWGLALIYQYEQDPQTRKAIDRALRFFFRHTRAGPVDGSLLIAYPGARVCRRNTGYAYEGLIHAYRIAKSRGDERAKADLGSAIDQGLYKITSWQVGGPLQAKSQFLVAHPTTDPLAVGGIMNHSSEAPLRIDVAQHQLHAVILALKYAGIRN